MNITELSVNDLKALAFDEMQRRNLSESNLKVIYAEISKRLQEPAKPANRAQRRQEKLSNKPLKKAPKNDNRSKN